MINIVESDRGNLTAIDLTKLIFLPKRIFIVNNVSLNEWRSDHAHRLDHQVLFCLNGRLKVELTNKFNDSIHKQLFFIEAGETIDIPPLTWSRIQFIKDRSEFLCVCSESYDENEYIRNYSEFLEIINAQ